MPRSNPELAQRMGERMCARRKELALTQEQVAELAGIAYQQYNKAENGKVCLGADSLWRVAAALQTSADFLLTGEHSGQRYAETAKLLDQMSDSQRIVANRMLQCMLDFSGQ